MIIELDDGVRHRLTVRFGDDVAPWLDEVPAVLARLADRWGIESGGLIPRGTMSVVVGCRLSDGRPAVLKVSPDRERLKREAAALQSWAIPQVPSVFEVDPEAGALLMEAIEPGTILAEAKAYPPLDRIGGLLAALHTARRPDFPFPSLRARVAYLFDSWAGPRSRNPELVSLVAPDLFERGRRLATRLAEEPSAAALLHGDLTPVNVLDGGDQRGLVAIDPAPCVGDPAFDGIDLMFWQADDVETVSQRAESLATAMAVDAERLMDWCAAFAGMFALDLAELPNTPERRIRTALALAEQGPPT